MISALEATKLAQNILDELNGDFSRITNEELLLPIIDKTFKTRKQLLTMINTPGVTPELAGHKFNLGIRDNGDIYIIGLA